MRFANDNYFNGKYNNKEIINIGSGKKFPSSRKIKAKFNYKGRFILIKVFLIEPRKILDISESKI